MSSKQERIKQCKADIKALQENLAELQKTEALIKFGDVVDSIAGKRVVLYDRFGRLLPINKNGNIMSSTTPPYPDFYRCIGINIFTDNILNLDW